MADRINLQKSYSSLNEKLAKLFDESGVRRSFTIPYVDGQQMDEHINTVGKVAAQSGGLTSNLLTTMHHSDGKGWGSGDGHTVAHPADKLRNTIIPKDDENAKSVIAAAQKHLNNIGKLVGDNNPAVATANSQLGLVKKTEGAGMNLLDFGVMMTQIMSAPTQAVAKMHSGTKDGGHSPQLRAPGPEPAAEPEQQETAQGEAQGGGEAPQGQVSAQAAPAAPEAQEPPVQA